VENGDVPGALGARAHRPAQQRRVDDAGDQSIDPDPLLGGLERDGTGETDDAGLGCDVGAGGGHADHAEVAGVDQDRSAAGVDQGRHLVIEAVEDAREVRRDVGGPATSAVRVCTGPKKAPPPALSEAACSAPNSRTAVATAWATSASTMA
jgi:hypothetical protein